MRTHLALFALAATLVACPSEEEPSPVGFVDGFLWGTASSTWQSEGDFDPDPNDSFDVRSNWTVWTQRGCVEREQTNPEGSGFYTKYSEDFALMASMGMNTVRVGVDWARVEPRDDEWNDAEVQHYVELLQAARAAGLEPMVTLYHWAVPTFVQNPAEDDAVDLLMGDPSLGVDAPFASEFREFVEYVTPAIAPYVDLYSILNEPFSVISVGYLQGGCGTGSFPPGALSIDAARTVHANLLFAHAEACRALRELDTADADGDGAPALCGNAATNNIVRPLIDGDPDDISGAERIDWIYNHATPVALLEGNVDLDFDRLFTTTGEDLPMDEGNYPELAGTLDFMGINYYGPIRVEGLPGGALGGFPYVDSADYDPTLPASTLGFAIDPGGFETIVTRFAEYGLPLYITENGLGEDGDADRPMFRVEHLDALQRAVAAGADVRGYYHWSLTDNFEWAHGIDQRFGLFRIDYEDSDLPRTRQGSADAYEAVIRANAVTDTIRADWVKERYESDGRL